MPLFAAAVITSQIMLPRARCTRWCCARPMRMQISHGEREHGADQARRCPRDHGGDVATLGGLPCQADIPGANIFKPPYPIIAADTCVTSAMRLLSWWPNVDHARDAAEAIEIEWALLPHVIGIAAAIAKRTRRRCGPGGAAISFSRPTLGDAKATARRVCAGGAHRLAHARQSARSSRNYLDTRGSRRRVRRATERITLTLAARAATSCAICCAATCSRSAASKMRVVTPDVGGGFGTKLFPYREYALAAFAARRLERPVKWVG